jgi:uncharacterized protein
MWNLLLYLLELLVLLYAGTCVVYWLAQEKFIFVPTLPGEPFEVRLSTPTSELFLNTPFNGTIHALWLKVPDSKGLIFYLHGNTGSIRRWQFMAEELAFMGYDVFVMDYRGYGKSKGRRTEAILHRDVEYCWDFIAARHAGKKIIYGRSLGSGFATRLAARRTPDAVVLETPFFSMLSLAGWYLPFIPMRWLLRYPLRNDLHIGHVDCPIHIFHGTRDAVVPYKSAFRLYRSIGDRRDVFLTTVAGGGHSDLNKYPLFHRRLKEFLDFTTNREVHNLPSPHSSSSAHGDDVG